MDLGTFGPVLPRAGFPRTTFIVRNQASFQTLPKFRGFRCSLWVSGSPSALPAGDLGAYLIRQLLFM